MGSKQSHQSSVPDIPNQDTDPGAAGARGVVPPGSGERRDIDTHIADADKVARTGKPEEKIRNTPPFGGEPPTRER
jgi:hypothetical protein